MQEWRFLINHLWFQNTYELYDFSHCAKKPVTTMLTYPWKCTVLHCNHLGNTWKPLVRMTRHFHYCPSVSEGDNQSVRSSAPVVSRCFPGGYNVKLYISRGRLAWWLLAFLCCVINWKWHDALTFMIAELVCVCVCFLLVVCFGGFVGGFVFLLMQSFNGLAASDQLIYTRLLHDVTWCKICRNHTTQSWCPIAQQLSQSFSFSSFLFPHSPTFSPNLSFILLTAV